MNREYDRGQLSSLLAGLDAIDRPGVSAALVTLVDVPLVSASTVRAVIEHYRGTHAPIVRPTSGDRHGHPLLIDRSLFAALRAADPAAGAKPIVRAHASAAGDIAIDDEGAFIDIDTEEDYRKTISDRTARRRGTPLRRSGVCAGPMRKSSSCIRNSRRISGSAKRFGDEPRADARRYFAHGARRHIVDPYAVDLFVRRAFF